MTEKNKSESSNEKADEKEVSIDEMLAKTYKGKKKEKPFKCEECGRRYSYRKSMYQHMYSAHQDQKPHVCDICGKAFPNKGNMNAHIAHAHTGEKPHKCEPCGKRFALPGELNYHQKKICDPDRKNESPWYCDKHPNEKRIYFTSIESYRQHLKDHKRETKLVCKACPPPPAAPRVFAHYPSIHKHYKKEHPDRLDEVDQYNQV